MPIQCLPMMQRLQLLVYAPLVALMIFYDNEFKILTEYALAYTRRAECDHVVRLIRRIYYVIEFGWTH